MLQLMTDINKCDMHIHTCFSDGEDSPEEAIMWARNCGMECVAITDHDDVRGVKRAEAQAEKLGMIFHSGIELSTDFKGIKLHILGYDIDTKDEALKKACTVAAARRVDRNKKLVEVLNKTYGLTWEEVKAETTSEYVGRPHMAKALVKKGLADDVRDAFKKIFSKPEIASVKKENMSAAEAINIIKGAGGTPVLAHPGKIREIGEKGSEEFFENVEKIILELSQMGLEGLECIHKDHSEQEADNFMKMAQKLNLLTTRGSDHH